MFVSTAFGGERPLAVHPDWTHGVHQLPTANGNRDQSLLWCGAGLLWPVWFGSAVAVGTRHLRFPGLLLRFLAEVFSPGACGVVVALPKRGSVSTYRALSVR